MSVRIQVTNDICNSLTCIVGKLREVSHNIHTFLEQDDTIR